MIRGRILLSLGLLVVFSTACRSESVTSNELRAIREMLESQNAQQPPGSGNPAQNARALPLGGATGVTPPPGVPAGGPPASDPPAVPQERPEILPSAPVSPLIVMVPDSADSVLDGENRLILRGTVWAVTSERLPILAGRNLPESAFFVFRDRDMQVFSPNGQLSFAVDYLPGDLSCHKLRPCFTITDELGRLHPVWYEIRRDEANHLRFHVLDCIRREEAENGEFPSDELLATNGNLVAVHRTEDRLCLRPLSDIGYSAVRLEDNPAVLNDQK